MDSGTFAKDRATNAPAEGEGGGLNFRVVVGAVRKYWVVATLATLVVTVGVAFFTLQQTKIYEANATLMFDPQAVRPLGDDVQTLDLGSAYWNNKEYYKTQFWVLKSLRVTSAVVSQLELNKDPTFLNDQPSSRKLPPQKVSVESAAHKLTNGINVDQVKDSRLATVTYRDADPVRAQRVLTTLIETFLQQNLEDVQETSDSANDWLHSQLVKLKADLETSEMALHEYKKGKNILSVSFDDQSNLLRAEMTQLNQAVTQARTQREAIRARRDAMEKVNLADPLSVPADEMVASSQLHEFQHIYVQAIADRDALLGAGKGENHPEVAAANARAAAAQEALNAELGNIRAALTRQLEAANQQVGGLSGLFEQANAKAMDLNLLEIEYNRLYRAKENNEKLFSLVLNRSKESDLTRVVRTNNIRIAGRPERPTFPVTPDVPVNLAVGLLLGLTLGLGLAVGRELLDRSIKTPEDAEQHLGTTFLGLIPQTAPDAEQKGDRRAGRSRRANRGAGAGVWKPELVVHDTPASAAAEAARAVRTNIVFMSPDRAYRTLLVTSASPTEGKTTVACSIAIAMAQAGQRVALLDCDMRRPRIHRVFGKSNGVGLTSALLDRSVLGEIALSTHIPNLWVVPTGPLPPTPAELFHSASFAEILGELRERFDLLVVDSPPVGPVTDAAILSTLVDGTLVVVRAFKTKKDLARLAVRTLRAVGARIVGVVLNAVDFDRNRYGYQYYSYYHREEYLPDEPLESKAVDAAS